MNIALKAGERIFINNAVLRADRRVRLELMNNATFLLESHFMQESEATSPLRQLYFVMQTMMIDEPGSARARALFDRMLADMFDAYRNIEVRTALKDCHRLIVEKRPFEAMKVLKRLFPIDDELVPGKSDAEN